MNWRKIDDLEKFIQGDDSIEKYRSTYNSHIQHRNEYNPPSQTGRTNQSENKAEQFKRGFCLTYTWSWLSVLLRRWAKMPYTQFFQCNVPIMNCEEMERRKKWLKIYTSQQIIIVKRGRTTKHFYEQWNRQHSLQRTLDWKPAEYKNSEKHN